MRVPLLRARGPTALGGLAVAVPASSARTGRPRHRAVELFHWSTSVLMTCWSLVAPARSCSRRYQRHGRELWRAGRRAAPARRPGLGRRARPAGAPAGGRSCGPVTATSSTPTPTGPPPPRAGSGAAAPGPERQRPGLPDGGRGRCRRDRRRRGGAGMSLSAVLLNGLVALPFAFAVLTRLLGRRGADSPSVSRSLGGRAHLRLVGVGVRRRLGGARRQRTSTTPGSPSSACAGTSGSTGSAARWC